MINFKSLRDITNNTILNCIFNATSIKFIPKIILKNISQYLIYENTIPKNIGRDCIVAGDNIICYANNCRLNVIESVVKLSKEYNTKYNYFITSSIDNNKKTILESNNFLVIYVYDYRVFVKEVYFDGKMNNFFITKV